MEHLQKLMRCVDDISNIIPEGTYLEMCNTLKFVHENIPKCDDPPTVDSRSVPFQAVRTNLDIHRIVNDSDSDSDDEGEEYYNMYDEWVENECTLQRLVIDLKVTERSLKTLKQIRNITKTVREQAIKEFCNNDQRLVGLGEWTFENLNQNSVYSSDAERRECTSKQYERALYMDYKVRYNTRVERMRHEARELKFGLEREISELSSRQESLREQLH